MSPSTGRAYPLTMICKVWRVGRSTVYAARDREESDGPAEPKKRGPKTKLGDEELVEEIRPALPFGSDRYVVAPPCVSGRGLERNEVRVREVFIRARAFMSTNRHGANS